jgi:hypothetical protein
VKNDKEGAWSSQFNITAFRMTKKGLGWFSSASFLLTFLRSFSTLRMTEEWLLAVIAA